MADSRKTGRTFEIYIKGVVTERDDKFLARIPALHISAFGDTIQAARERVGDGLLALLDETARRSGVDAALDRLTRANLHYEEVHIGHWQQEGLIVEAPAAGDRMLAGSGVA